MASSSPSLDDSALLIVDIINDFDFPDGDELLQQTRGTVAAIDALRQRYAAARRPVIYVNDNFGRWRSDFEHIVDYCRRDGAAAAAIVQRLAPRHSDYFVLKPRHSAFFHTPLALLLRELKVHALTVVGVAGDQCVLNTAVDAHMRDYPLWVPSDGVASITAARNARALAHMREVLQADTTPVLADAAAERGGAAGQAASGEDS